MRHGNRHDDRFETILYWIRKWKVFKNDQFERLSFNQKHQKKTNHMGHGHLPFAEYLLKSWVRSSFSHEHSIILLMLNDRQASYGSQRGLEKHAQIV